MDFFQFCFLIANLLNTMNFITANQLKTKGISAIESFAKKGMETVVKVRGVDKYVILTIEDFNHLRECELIAALMEAEKEVAKGNYHDSIEDHLRRIRND